MQSRVGRITGIFIIFLFNMQPLNFMHHGFQKQLHLLLMYSAVDVIMEN